MNKERRKGLQEIIDQLEELKASVEEYQEEEEEYPFSIQSLKNFNIAPAASRADFLKTVFIV